GECAHFPANTGGACADDGNACTVDVCGLLGDCIHPGAVGRACPDDGSVCTSDYCDLFGSCIHPPDLLATGQYCGPAVGECGAPNFCLLGLCVDAKATLGTPCSGDGVACTLDICDGFGTCSHAL